MPSWRACDHARMLESLLRVSSRSSVDDGLELLRQNDYETLRRATTSVVRGQPTWAKVAEAVVEQLKMPLLSGPVGEALEAAERARTLAERLRARDAHPSARVTTTLRSRIGALERLALCVEAAVRLKEGAAADEADVGRLIALRQRWTALRREQDEDAWVRSLALAAAGAVLASDDVGLQAMATRAVVRWADSGDGANSDGSETETEEATESATESAPESATERRKRRLQWSDADEELV